VIWKVSIAKVRKKKTYYKKWPNYCIWFSVCSHIYIEGWLKYMVCSQIWLNLPRDNCHFLNMHKILWQPVKWNLAL
jgi:hypothetical protein